MKRRQNRNISEIELACNIPPDPDTVIDNTLHIGGGVALRGHSGPVRCVSVQPRAGLVLAAAAHQLRAWRLHDHACAAVYKGHNYPIWCMDVSPSSLFLATGSQDRTARLWALDQAHPVRVFVGHLSDVTCVKFHPNSAYLATGGLDRSVRLWGVCDARLVRVLWGHRGAVRALAFSPSGQQLASAGDDKKIKVWDLSACSCLHEYRHHGKVTDLDWSAVGRASLAGRGSADAGDDNSLLCSAGMDGIVKIVYDHNAKSKPSSSQEVHSYTYNTKCSYLVDVQVHPDWVVAIGAKR